MVELSLSYFGGRGGKSSLSSGLPDAVRKTVEAEEKKIYNRKTEAAVIINSSGDVVLKKSQRNKNSVHFSALECLAMKGATLTHNHPNGSTFSNDDIKMLTKWGIQTLRATSKNQTYQLTKTRDSKKAGDFASDFSKALNDSIKTTNAEYKGIVADFNSGKLSLTDANKKIKDLNAKVDSEASGWLQKNSNNYGYSYSVINRKGIRG